ncbi:PRC-barrel domain-containing protein [Geodermatophilus pulveris]|uniref:PRC-barrel domain-containing protein n=1 Tax=Geodermatophilus pulveris TaxID=1564159 RepID=A0A239CGT5_9ACTN|nr:PRC-barrel domain-containing protein [Geodermatophilus pulveris]SNS18878.1 PRC-barrel domain-containing protein [Geodermatophilus pulveris]
MAAGTLYRLSETDRTVADPDADVRGRAVVDRHGEEAGRVDDLLVDDREGRVRFLSVGEGGLLGLGKTHYLVPVDAVVAVDADRVRIDRDRAGMGGVPVYDPELADRPDYYESVYGWWGTAPFWGPGYAYPPFPR